MKKCRKKYKEICENIFCENIMFCPLNFNDMQLNLIKDKRKLEIKYKSLFFTPTSFLKVEFTNSWDAFISRLLPNSKRFTFFYSNQFFGSRFCELLWCFHFKTVSKPEEIHFRRDTLLLKFALLFFKSGLLFNTRGCKLKALFTYKLCFNWIRFY